MDRDRADTATSCATGGAWSLVRTGQVWKPFTGEATAARARAVMSEDTAWRLYFGYPGLDPTAQVRFHGGAELARVVSKALAVMA